MHPCVLWPTEASSNESSHSPVVAACVSLAPLRRHLQPGPSLLPSATLLGRNASIAIRRLDQVMRDAGLLGRVSGVGDEDEVGLGHLLVQLKRRGAGAHDVVAPLHDCCWDMADLAHMREE